MGGEAQPNRCCMVDVWMECTLRDTIVIIVPPFSRGGP